jgi:hypothetical protein
MDAAMNTPSAATMQLVLHAPASLGTYRMATALVPRGAQVCTPPTARVCALHASCLRASCVGRQGAGSRDACKPEAPVQERSSMHPAVKGPPTWHARAVAAIDSTLVCPRRCSDQPMPDQQRRLLCPCRMHRLHKLRRRAKTLRVQ